MKRRQFVGGALGAAVLGAGTPALAHPPEQLPAYDLPPALLPREIDFFADLPPYEIHVVPDEFALYWTLPNQRAMRYVVGVGRPGLYEAGEFYVGARKEWPSWTPTPGMLEREPERYQQYADGMPGGLNNPLGSRALYLFDPERGDTFLRIHGTNEPSTLGQRVSNGCARLVNDQMIELYDQVPMDTRVVLHPQDV
ncbi:L,D-transpeptidase [Marinovum sp.]|uniref:L,D-transpeptidase n=1 Tax=Marinovum sp. TaxID=2024839 RepID=UPI002B2650C0|nr:L,D-transpeptidase [Marinovum sp.]